MKRSILILSFLLASCAKDDTTLSKLSNFGGVTVQSSNDRPDYPANGTIDGVYNTFMTTNILNMSDTVTLTYELTEDSDVESIDLINDYCDEYALGDLTISVSSDGSTWETITQMNASNHGFVNGDGNVMIQRNIKFLKLEMYYSGTGAYGMTPSFYLSEIIFH